MAATLPTQSNQFPNVIVRTAHHLTAFIDTVPVNADTWAYIAEGEWVELDATTGKYQIPGVGGGAGVNLSARKLWFTTGKTVEPSRQVMQLEVRDVTADQEGYLPVYAGHDPVEVDFKFYDEGVAWAVNDTVYVVSELDGDGNVRAILSTSSTGDGGAAGKAIGKCKRVPADNNGYVRVDVNAL